MKIAPENLSQFQFRPEAEDRCGVTVLYEDTVARERALSLCHHLVRGFWAEIDFAFSWWRFRFLQDPDIAQAAAEAAAAADVLLVSAVRQDDPPDEVRQWVELWIPRRSAEGVLFALLGDDASTEVTASPLRTYLQTVARRAGMDCLPRVGDEPWLSAPESVRRIENRALQGSRVLDDILRHWGSPPTLPSHWGINE
jgi:hypothetical protein